MENLILCEPEEIDYWLRLNAALLAAGRLTEAHERMLEILKVHSHHPGLLFWLAVALGALKKLEEAEWVLAGLFSLENVIEFLKTGCLKRHENAFEFRMQTGVVADLTGVGHSRRTSDDHSESLEIVELNDEARLVYLESLKEIGWATSGSDGRPACSNDNSQKRCETCGPPVLFAQECQAPRGATQTGNLFVVARIAPANCVCSCHDYALPPPPASNLSARRTGWQF